MPLLKQGKKVEDAFTRIEGDDALPGEGAVLVDLARFQQDKAALLDRGAPIGVLLRSDEAAEDIAEDLDHLALVALDFPAFTDGRAYSTARVLRERYGYEGEVRAVGDVLLEYLHFLDRCGFDAFELNSDDPEHDWQVAQEDWSVWYQPTGDRRTTVMQRRHS